MKQQLNFYENLPTQILNQLNDIYPPEKNDLQFFLKNTEFCHDLNEWIWQMKNRQTFFNKLLAQQYSISVQDANLIKNAIQKNEQIIIFNKPIFAKNSPYSEMHRTKQTIKYNTSRIYIRPLKIYLTN